MKGCRPLTDAEIQGCLAVLSKGSHPERDTALFHLGLRTGFRISEILSLTVGDVYQNVQIVDEVYVARRNMKKKREGRRIKLHEEARSAISALVSSLEVFYPASPLFQSQKGGALNRKSAWLMLRKAYAAAGLNGKLGTHSMRKTFAKRIYEKLGKDLLKTQKALDHASVTSTAAYLSFNQDDIDDAILKS